MGAIDVLYLSAALSLLPSFLLVLTIPSAFALYNLFFAKGESIWPFPILGGSHKCKISPNF